MQDSSLLHEMDLTDSELEDRLQDQTTPKEWACSFRFNGRMRACNVYANTREEAEMQLRAIGSNGVVEGPIVAKIPASTGPVQTGVFVWLWVWFRNALFHR